jgi:hypothetical protein
MYLSGINSFEIGLRSRMERGIDGYISVRFLSLLLFIPFLYVFHRGEGDETPNAPVADVMIVVEEEPHPLFKRDGNNLVHKVLNILSSSFHSEFLIREPTTSPNSPF